MKRYKSVLILAMITGFVALICADGGQAKGIQSQGWQIHGVKSIVHDPAVSKGLMELKITFKEQGLLLENAENKAEKVNTIVLNIGEPLVAVPETRSEKELTLLLNSAYQITTQPASPKIITIIANSPLGLSYALFDLADEIRVNERIPDINKNVIPTLPYRFNVIGSQVPNTYEGPDTSLTKLKTGLQEFEKVVTNTLKYGYNFVIVQQTENFIPWSNPFYKIRSQKYRKYLKHFIKIAHANHLQMLLLGDEFVYLPDEFNKPENISIKDETLWHLLQKKYRELFTLCPELDGTATRIGEIYPQYDFKGLDLIHSPEFEPDPRIEKRYRKFIKTMHQVVAQEFGKIYLHRTWVTNVHEQHSIPQIYKSTFTKDVPMDNLLLTIKLTSGDQWYPYEPYNATYGQTPHTTIAQGEIYSGYQGGGSYIEYPARYFQAALEWAVDRNTRGIFNNIADESLPRSAIIYVFSKLGWNPLANVDSLTEDWAATNFGKEVRKEIAEIFLMASAAVRDGLYLRQPGLHNWSPIRHVRTNSFVRKGNPVWDYGKEHDNFLKDIYLECKPWLPQTKAELNKGVQISQRMLEIYQGCKYKIKKVENSAKLEKFLKHGLAVMQLNRAYAIGFLDYFVYREQPTDRNKTVFSNSLKTLKQSVHSYKENHQHYKLIGIFTFLDLAERVMNDIEKAEQILYKAPTSEEIKKMFTIEKTKSKNILEQHPEALHCATFQSTIDGRDILKIKGDDFSIEHIADDPMSGTRLILHQKIPQKSSCKIIVKPLEVRGTVYLMEQPSVDNKGTIKLYLEDSAVGQTVFRFELYAVCE